MPHKASSTPTSLEILLASLVFPDGAQCQVFLCYFNNYKLLASSTVVHIVVFVRSCSEHTGGEPFINIEEDHRIV